jgi:hypothetical protein
LRNIDDPRYDAATTAILLLGNSPTTVDVHDPLYQPEVDDDPNSYVLSSGGGGGGSEKTMMMKRISSGTSNDIITIAGPLLTLNEFKIRISDTIREYFDSSDVNEVVRCIAELSCYEYHPEVIKRAVSLGLDAGPRERELISQLLACLHPNPLTDNEMEKGFGLVLDSIDDLCIDIPDAKVSKRKKMFTYYILIIQCTTYQRMIQHFSNSSFFDIKKYLYMSIDSSVFFVLFTHIILQAMIGSFLARAVIDEVLPPAFLSNRNNSHPGDPVVEKAVGLLSREHCTARLERVWGPGDGRPVSELKDSMDQLLKEYLLSRELDEAASCVRELKSVHFHHELVKRGVRIAMEEDGGRCELALSYNDDDNNNNNKNKNNGGDSSSLDAMAALFVFLVNNSIVSEYQVAKGIDRLRRTLDDVKLDVPAAPEMLDEFEIMAKSILLKKIV